MDQITLGGGCFWCTEAIYKRLKGVTKVTSGYSGSDNDSPTYEKVSSGKTDFAESIQIEFDPKIISFKKILEIFFATHDPTTKNQQGGDYGPQYRSVIFYHNAKQKELAEKSKESHKGAVTEIVPFKKFYKAEDYHQNYYDTYKDSNSYCTLVINPKIEKLLIKFNSEVKDQYK